MADLLRDVCVDPTEEVAMRIIEDVNRVLRTTVETERSRKRRAKKAWAKPKYVTTARPDPSVLKTSFGYIAHPAVARELPECAIVFGRKVNLYE